MNRPGLLEGAARSACADRRGAGAGAGARRGPARGARGGAAQALVARFDIEPYSDCSANINDQTLQGSFSSVSTPNFAGKYSLESS